MDHRRQPVLRPPHLLEQPVHAVEAQVDEFGVKRQEAI
jgi:hypothetical protein